MPGIQILKKKLKSIRATGKLSKAMKTVSAVKFSRLSARYKSYAAYADEYRFLYRAPDSDLGEADCVLILGSNRGFCGGFHNDLLNFAKEHVLSAGHPAHLICCGERITHLLTDAGFTPDRSFILEDIPSFGGCGNLFSYLEELAAGQTDFRLAIIFPAYRNTLLQIPSVDLLILNSSGSREDAQLADDGDTLWIPDRETVLSGMLARGARTLLYERILETALGAQAATLMTMRSAYDTAVEYGEALEAEIHRRRQSEVTADVLETSSERNKQGGEKHG